MHFQIFVLWSKSLDHTAFLQLYGSGFCLSIAAYIYKKTKKQKQQQQRCSPKHVARLVYFMQSSPFRLKSLSLGTRNETTSLRCPTLGPVFVFSPAYRTTLLKKEQHQGSIQTD